MARSRDGGKTWKLLSRGLPQKDAHLLVFREAMASDALSPAGVYAGTSTGQLFHTADAGETWAAISEHLPPILSVAVSN